jgi:pseudouridine-5'-phosphate glycosidase
LGATTVGSTLAIATLAGIRFVATGGLGGVHRGFTQIPDISADLAELTRSPVLIVSSGVKSLLDVPATAEVLESLSIPVLGWRTDTLPLFYVAAGGPPVGTRVETAEEAARIAQLHWFGLHRSGALVLGRPPRESLDDIEALIDEALAAAARDGLSGQGVTPYVLGYLHDNSAGRTAAANKELFVDNATLAAQVAVAYAGL